MSYPLLKINIEAVRSNLESIVSRCAARGLSVWSVTKGFSCAPELVRVISETDIAAIADSRMENLISLKREGIGKPLALIRIPMLSELEKVVEYADYSVVSETATLRALADICDTSGRTHRVIVMVDMGDLREGFWPDEAEQLADCIPKLSPALRVDGIGVNYACASGVKPTKESHRRFVSFGRELERLAGIKLNIISGGSTTRSLLELGSDFLAEGINNLRIGEGYLLGTDSGADDPVIPWLRQDTFTIEAEVVEVRVKPSQPLGEIGIDAFGNVPYFEDRGRRLRAILAIGKQDIHLEGLKPLDEGVEIITASSDHLLVDVEECPRRPQVGSVLRFRPGYPAMLGASTSKYVKKEYV